MNEQFECPFCHETATVLVPAGLRVSIVHECRVCRRQMPMERREAAAEVEIRTGEAR